MPVIINEFEVVVQQPQNQQPQSVPQQPPPPAPPKDMERLIEHFKQRRARLHAD